LIYAGGGESKCKEQNAKKGNGMKRERDKYTPGNLNLRCNGDLISYFLAYFFYVKAYDRLSRFLSSS
jgi:hypothetical protein